MNGTAAADDAFNQSFHVVMKSVTVILNDAPYGNERAYNGLRYAHALLAASAQVKVYLLADAVTCAKKGQTPPKG